MQIISQETITQITQTLAQDHRIKMAFLFGSYAKNTARPGSDLDIAIYLNEPYQPIWVQEIWGQIESLARKEVDLIVLNRAPATICWAAIRGKALIIKDEKFYTQYMLDCSREAEDFQEYIFDLWRLRQQYKEERHVTPES